MAIKHFPAAYETLLQGKAIRCASTGTTFPAASPPSAVILDVFALPQLKVIRSLSGTQTPIFAFVCTHSAVLIRIFGPESMGGRGDFGARLDAEALRLGKTTDEIGEQMLKHIDGTVVRISGIPDMYDYEYYPQVTLSYPAVELARASYELLMTCDGIFAGTAPAYDGDSFAALETCAREGLNKPIYPIGPLLPPGYSTQQMPLSSTVGGLETQSFLDSIKRKHGTQSMLFISFGTIFWPRVQDQIEDLVDVLIEKQFPFFICHAAPDANVPPALSQKIKESGIGMASPWAPQHSILTHPVTGWFVTHCGHGGVIEALASGVPMICWPFEGDQPIAAMHLSKNLNIAFHLIEVRTAKGLQPLHSGAVPLGTRAATRTEFEQTIYQCRGEVGAEKRRNAQRIRGELASAWAPGGSATRAVDNFLREYVSPPTI
ncbi:hypothetical protein K438DRAFT_450137 [Mycena galopus ATCC 62051]|nr:hypothetical protein K438DRAFT_450137 [Mycena galopus ATCC 62051]